MTYLGLYALQHRGQESAGISASDGHLVRLARAMGYVADVFDSQTLSDLPGSLAIGHETYATTGSVCFISMWLYVEDCDALYNRALKAGATVPDGPMGQLADQFWGDRCGILNDPFGYSWTIATHKEDLSKDEIDQRFDAFLKQMGGQVPAHQ